MLELLAPAGSPEAVTAAVQSGADAVYLGYGDFNARRNAKNFSAEELAAAVSYCHLRDVKVYLTLNTLLTDRELPRAAETAAYANEIGVDAVILQDLGLAKLLRDTVPEMELHGSTQMTVHSLAGCEACARLGLRRVVLARELPREEIAFLCQHAPVEIEVFVHGALCMCYSGQCYLSSLIGGRSGNRGLCAQPCRLAYAWPGQKKPGYPLSLKDLSLAGRLAELQKMGVASLKIEGRMKRPEYVSVVTGIYAAALREGREPTAEERRQLELAFSRQGFTQGYYLDKTGPGMFGIRTEGAEEPKELFDEARDFYLGGERRQIPVAVSAKIRGGEPVTVAVEDSGGHRVSVQGSVPETARNRETTEEQVKTQLSKTGGTVYRCGEIRAEVEPGLSVPVSALNALRRQALEELSDRRIQCPPRQVFPFRQPEKTVNPRQTPRMTVSLRRGEQLTEALLKRGPAVVYLPAEEIPPRQAEWTALCRDFPQTQFAVTLPRVAWDRELPRLNRELEAARKAGFTAALTGNLGLMEQARGQGFLLRGDYGLGVFNSLTVEELGRLGFRSLTASFELRLAQIRDLSKAVDLEMPAYGRLPLMLTENCIIQNRGQGCRCEEGQVLRDRKGLEFPVEKAWGCRNEILNARTLFLADKEKEYAAAGLWAVRLVFTTEKPEDCLKIADRYLGRGDETPVVYTRGLYFRDVE